jgi:hypothetical protein
MIINYKLVDGAHFFTSQHKYGIGMCVAHTDINICFKDIKNQLRNLLKHNHNIENVKIEIPISSESFLAVGIKSLNVQVFDVKGDLIA